MRACENTTFKRSWNVSGLTFPEWMPSSASVYGVWPSFVTMMFISVWLSFISSTVAFISFSSFSIIPVDSWARSLDLVKPIFWNPLLYFRLFEVCWRIVNIARLPKLNIQIWWFETFNPKSGTRIYRYPKYRQLSNWIYSVHDDLWLMNLFGHMK